ncbi:MAG: PH domain-containing protein [archaeon]|nr:PH domain-containing protein [archaeon]
MTDRETQIRIDHEVRRVWTMLHPQPHQRGKRERRFLREGPLKQWSFVQKRVKKKHLFLFSDCLLVTRRDSSHRYQMKIFVFLTAIKGLNIVGLATHKRARDTIEFHLHTPRKNLIFFSISRPEAESWIQSLQYAVAGCLGPVPPSVFRYGDELDPQELPLEVRMALPAPSSRPPAASSRPRLDLTDSDSDDAVPLVDFIGADSTSFAVSKPLHSGGFDPFGLQNNQSAPQHAAATTTAASAPAPSSSSAAPAPAAAPQAVSAPVFLPNTSLGIHHLLQELISYLGQLPHEVPSQFLHSLLAQIRDAAHSLDQTVRAFTASPSAPGRDALVECHRVTVEFVTRMRSESFIASQARPQTVFHQQLAAALNISALALEQFTTSVQVHIAAFR